MQNFKTKQDKTGYSGLAKVFHWSFVAIFAYGIYKQVDNISQLGDSALLRFEVILAAVFFNPARRAFFIHVQYTNVVPTREYGCVTKTRGKSCALRHVYLYGIDRSLWIGHWRTLYDVWTRGHIYDRRPIYARNLSHSELLVDRLACYRGRLSPFFA